MFTDLSFQVDVNAAIQSHGTTYSPLMLAVKYKQDEMVRHLLMVRGINVGFRNSMLQSPVLFAVQNNDIDLVNLLLSAEDSIHSNRMEIRRQQLRDVHQPCAMLETIKQGRKNGNKIIIVNFQSAPVVKLFRKKLHII